MYCHNNLCVFVCVIAPVVREVKEPELSAVARMIQEEERPKRRPSDTVSVSSFLFD
jgi:hypothetical protein